MPRFASPESYTPAHLAEKILTSKSTLEGERKQVTVLFADLKGSMELLADRDPEEARKLLDPVLEHMMEAVHRYEGTVNQVMGDGIMALFGAPLAHEDHAVRACYAALRMQDTLKRYGDETRRSHGVEVQIRVGLNSGEVVVRSVGSDLHMDYTAVGQTTHLAARMEQLAPPGTVRMTGETMRLTEGYVEVRSLGPMPVKGLSEPVEVFELRGAGQARTRLQAAALRGLTRFVGRDAEIEQLRRVLGRASAGHGQVVAVVGEAGVGKSRLTYEFAHSHRVQDWLILEASSVSYGKATSYLPVIDLLKGYFKIGEGDELREIRERVTGKLLALDRALEGTLPALLSLFDVSADDEAWRRLDPAQRRQRTLDAVKSVLLREAREQPLLLIFEDLHWIDGETQALLDSLVESLGSAPMLLLVNYRPEYEHRWGSKTYYSQMRLDALPVETAGELLDALLGHDPSLAPLKQLLVRRGNPFFLEETVRTLMETKALVGGEGHYRLTQPVPSIQVPATVQAILAARIDRLPARVKHVLQAAAVIGKNASFALLAAIADQSENELLRGLNHLQTAEFLYETSLFPEVEYSFKHALTLEVAYQSLLRDRRRVLHRRVLETLERRWLGREAENTELLAHHASRADLWDRAARYFYQAGERAFANARYPAGITFFQAAVDALDTMGDAADLRLKLDAWLELWSARVTISQFDSLRELGENAAALARHLDDGPRLAQVQVRQAQAIVYLGVIPEGLERGVEMAREAFARAEPGDVRTRSYAQFIIGNAYRELGRLPDAVREFHTGLELFDGLARHGAERGLVFPICVSLGAWCAEAEAARGAFEEALESARRALQLATDINHVNSVSVASSYLGYVHVLLGEFATAVPLLERGIAIAIEQKLPRRPGEALPYLAYALVMLGQREQGLDCLARARQASMAEKAHWSAYGALRAAAYLAAGCPEEAKDEIQRGLTDVNARSARGYRGPLRCVEGEILAWGDSAAALDRFGEALVLATEVGMRPLAAHCHHGLSKLYWRTGRREQAHEHFTTATTMYREMGMRFYLDQIETEHRAIR